MIVFGGMLVLGIVTTAHMPAGPAKPQVHPGVSHREAFLAALAARSVSLH